MPKVKANGLEFEYEAFGDHANPPLLLVMGLGAQMTTWPEPFCLMLANRGFYVVRYDNRDSAQHSNGGEHVTQRDWFAEQQYSTSGSQHRNAELNSRGAGSSQPG